MPCRLTVVLAAALAVPAAVLPALPAAAAAPPTLFTVDKVHFRLPPYTQQRVLSPATLAAHAATGGVSLSHTAGNTTTTLLVAPPAGQQFAAGTSFPVKNATPTDTTGQLFTGNQCASTATASGIAGTVTVHEATYTDGAVTALALDYEVACATDATGTYAGSLRHGSERPYALLRTSVVGDVRSGVGMPVPVTVRLHNAGTAETTAGAAALSGTYAADYAVTTDGCSGTTLAPGQECDIVLSFTPGALGDRRVRVDVPGAGYPRATGAGAFVLGTGVAAPPTPADLRAWPVAGGVRLSWSNGGTSAPITSVTVYRRATADDAWSALATLGSVIGYTDQTLGLGETAQYAVASAGPGGTSDKSAPGTARRAATEPVAGTVDALVVDMDPASGRPGVVADKAAGDHVQRNMGYRTGGVSGSAGGGTYSAMFGTVPGPGTYDVGGAAGVPMYLGLEGSACVPTSGTLTVHEVLYDETEALAVAAASFTVACAGTVRGELRWQSTLAYQGVRVTAPTAEWRVPAGTSGDRTITVTAKGSLPVTFGAATLSGTGAGYFSVVGNGCQDQSLAGGQSCEVVVRATMSGSQQRTAYLGVADDTPAAAHGISLAAVPTSVPSAPAVVTRPRIGSTLVSWSRPSDTGNAPVTAYHLYRQVGDAEPVLLTTTAQHAHTDTRSPGSTARYGVAAVNEVGTGPVGWGPVETAPSAELLYAGGTHTSYLHGVVPPSSLWFDAGAGAGADTVAASPDGTKIAYALPNGTGADLYVADADGTGTPLNLTGATMPGYDEYDPAFSNDGKTIAFTRASQSEVSVWTVPVTGGTPKLRAGTAASPAWLADSRTLVVSDYSAATAPLQRVAPDGKRTAIAGTGLGDQPAVSPDGRWLAFERYDEQADAAGLAVVPVGGAPAPVLLADPAGTREWADPAWRPDGASLAVTYVNYDTMTLGVREVGWNGTALAPGGMLTTGEFAWGPAWRAVGVALTSAPAVTRSTTKVGIALSAPYTSATCRLDGGAPVACGTGWTGTGLAKGTHTLVVTASAHGVATRVLAHTWTVDTTAPTLSVSQPSKPFTTAASATFTYAGSDPSGVVSYDARFRSAPYSGGFGGYSSPAGWTATTARTLTKSLQPGYEYCFSVRARDAAGNVSGWSADRCTGSPLDDRSLSASSGWTRSSGSTSYRGTYTGTTRSGATLTRSGVQAKRLALVATRCPACGSVAVYLGSTLVGNVSLVAGTTQKAYVVALPAFTTVRSGTVTVKVTSSGKTVQVDGLGVRRT